MGWKISRHGICQMFQFDASITGSKIPGKMRKSRHFLQTKNENVGCFTQQIDSFFAIIYSNTNSFRLYLPDC